ncbi:SMC-Scp complex subunit ScpB [Desulfosporosinus sp.]|uniref:SMC-Scp complex subunit ScpB n=1 Tax=Desulfosporosinus sp. TaxID=157907 RepID=UPI000E883FCA|nr:SMC-Scp complex subunit ScpB [Desulfosporosinus sp.]MBC2723047.1 SMC-Scp complex subunit ScpB [Desulfosporosinus sp.]MBC2726806.1 SMC-Scp complex subunit ScpB [Desulfosporosinus sp.]HBV89117.1 SMC-Scp complex subunit ScpB [Desulfosporosinus sp.]
MLFREPETAALEALLFVAKDPLTPELLVELLELDLAKIEELLYELRNRYAIDSCGLTLLEINGGYKLGTKPEVARYIETLYKQPAQALSNAALEVLSIIAYKQPVTRGEVDFIRGVQSDRALATLVEKGLVKEVGRKEGPGRPILYATTEQFLLHFGLRSLDDMPSLEMASLSEAEAASTEDSN